jgi:hypothetical protein
MDGTRDGEIERDGWRGGLGRGVVACIIRRDSIFISSKLRGFLLVTLSQSRDQVLRVDDGQALTREGRK